MKRLSKKSLSLEDPNQKIEFVVLDDFLVRLRSNDILDLGTLYLIQQLIGVEIEEFSQTKNYSILYSCSRIKIGEAGRSVWRLLTEHQKKILTKLAIVEHGHENGYQIMF